MCLQSTHESMRESRSLAGIQKSSGGENDRASKKVASLPGALSFSPLSEGSVGGSFGVALKDPKVFWPPGEHGPRSCSFIALRDVLLSFIGGEVDLELGRQPVPCVLGTLGAAPSIAEKSWSRMNRV